MKKISFAQNQEDILLDRVFRGRPEGFYIDVGACHPVFHSVTKFFYERGWNGINIEPIPSMFDILARDRERDVNLPVGLSNREGTLRFLEVPAAVGYSTFSGEQAEQLRAWGYELIEHEIPVTTLARVCERYAGRTIDFLKIDVESHEREVLEGGDWGRFRPRVVLIEATRPATTIACHEEWESVLLANDYLYACFDGLNRYYVRAEDRELLPALAVPANVLDDFETFEHFDRARTLERRVESLEQQIQEFHHQNPGVVWPSIQQMASLREALGAAREDAATTRAALEESGRVLDATRSALDGTRAELERMHQLCEGMQAELTAARARLELFEGWGPMTVSVVRRARRICVRLPLAKPMLRQALLLRRKLIAAVDGNLVPQ